MSHLNKMEAVLTVMTIMTMTLVAGMQARDTGSLCQPLLSGGAFTVSALGFRHDGCMSTSTKLWPPYVSHMHV